VARDDKTRFSRRKILTGQPCAFAGKTKISKDENERRDLPLLRASVVRNLSPL
jgi:hypothetical protein